MQSRVFGPATLELVQGDITHQTTAAIVNAANSSLMGGGGVDGAIHRAGGPAILAACKEVRRTQGRLATGEAVATTGGRLSAERVIHTVGPVWHGGDSGEPDALASCYHACIDIARNEGLSSVAFPSVSTGVYGYPVDKAAPVALTTVARELLADAGALTKVRFVLFDEPTLAAYVRALETLGTTLATTLLARPQ